jgi:photosystem II stability/assembly factor-like uncharacterized protein
MKKIVLIFVLLFTLMHDFVNGQWVNMSGTSNQPYISSTITCLAVKDTNLFAGTYGGGIFLSTDNGASWKDVNNGLAKGYIEFIAVKGTYIFAGTNGGGMFLSKNNGESWTTVNNGLKTSQMISFALDRDKLYVGTGEFGGVYILNNEGNSWIEINDGLHITDIIPSLVIANNFLFAGTNGWGVYLSTNDGTSWSSAMNGLTSTCIMSLAAMGYNLFAGTNGGGVFLSTNDGKNWSPVNNGLMETDRWVESFAVCDSNLFAGMGSGVFFTKNNGTNWNDFNNGFPDNMTIEVECLTINKDYLFAGTLSDGVWRRPLSDMITGIEKDDHDFMKDYSLEQNFPNPFNPSTLIRYKVPKVSNVSLKVFDMLGREVSTLVNEQKLPGKYEVKFDGSKLSSGVYLYKLQAGDFVQTKKLILIK